jgi:hypothetical protein
MPRNWIYKALAVGLVMLLYRPCTALDDAKLTKTINRSYPARPNTELEIQNKYGDVIVKGWDKDSVSILVTITAFGKDEEAARQLIDRTEIRFTNLASGIEAYTLVRKSDGWLRDFWNELSGYSQTIISKDQLTIDFLVYMPGKMSLDLNNKYGDVFLSERLGPTRIDLSNGNLKAEEIRGRSVLSFKFGTADINSIESADLLLKSAELNLEQADELTIQSNSSTLNIERLKSARITSRTDKITIREADQLTGQASFTKLRLVRFNGQLDLDTNYGSVTMEYINSRFSEILVRANSTDVELTFDHMAYFNARIVAKDGKFLLPRDHGMKQVYTDGTEKFIKSTGVLGKARSNPGEVDIDAQGGRVELDFAPFEVQSYKEN